MSVSPRVLSRGWWAALVVVLACAAFQVSSALHALNTGADEDLRPSFVVWGGVPALFALAVLALARKVRTPAGVTHGWVGAVAVVTAALYVWGYWLGYEAEDPAFLFIFAPLFQSGAYLVGGSFGLLLGAVIRNGSESPS